MHCLHVIDSHTEGEPTRLVLGGVPDLGSGPLPQRVEKLRSEHDWVRTAAVCEPRGSDAVVGALLCEPHDPSCTVGVIYFNNVGYLGMCGHGTIGLVRTLQYMGRLEPGTVRIDTPVGHVEAVLATDGRVTVNNVASYRHKAGVPVEVEGIGTLMGDIAYGGNWFFLISGAPVDLNLRNVRELTDFTTRIRRALQQQGITGEGGAEIDHIELFGPPDQAGSNSRNFVLCPGLAYDRSPCGTGLSAKLACLAADGKLAPGEVWRQESIVGSTFEGSYQPAGDPGKILPSISGTAFVTAEATLVLDPEDPFRGGILG